jgi:serine/threonine protein kinase
VVTANAPVMDFPEQPTLPFNDVPSKRSTPRTETTATVPSSPGRDTIVDGRYRILRRIGAGGSATVFYADDLRLLRPVALKILHPALVDDPVATERFWREGWTARRMHHERIARVYDWGVAASTHYIAMEYVSGRTLRSVLRAEPALTAAAATDLIFQILDAARHTHDQGVVHRDLKPENVIVDPRSRVKLIDFGVAGTGRASITPAGSLLGTVHYMAPELTMGGTPTAASDLYAIGVILYELLTGRRPFEADLAVAVAMAHVHTRAEPPARFNRAIVPELDAVVMRALEKPPTRRFPNAAAFIGALERATGCTAGRHLGLVARAT